MNPQSAHRTLIVLAAGKGTRMRSPRAKVLHPLMDRPLLTHLLESLEDLEPENTFVVVGHEREKVEKLLPRFGATPVVQEPQNGTGHALQCCRQNLEGLPPGEALLVAGDVPLIPVEELALFWEKFSASEAVAAVVAMELEDPEGYGRILGDSHGNLERIVEERDADPEEREIQLVNSGVYLFRLPAVLPLLDRIGSDNSQGEFYLTDLFSLLHREGRPALTFEASDPELWLGVNSQAELARTNAMLRAMIVNSWMDLGVTILDPWSTWIGPEAHLEPGVVLHPFVRILGETYLGEEAEVQSFTTINNCVVNKGSLIREGCVLEESLIGKGCTLGPICRTRVGTILDEGVHLGNFVETKKARLGKGVKAGHLSYLGDATVGSGSNVGAGTITCNYDGEKKHPTILGEGVFVGSGTQLVAPVTVGDGAYIGAGSTVTRDIPSGALAISRVQQRNIEGWVEKKKQRAADGKAEKARTTADQEKN